MSNPYTLFTVNGASGTELWSTDGAQQTLLTTQISSKVVMAGGQAYFASYDGIYTTDGTPEGTQRVQEAQGATQLVAKGDTLYFTAVPTPPPPPEPWEPGGETLYGYPQLFELSPQGLRQVTTESTVFTPGGPDILGVTFLSTPVVAGPQLYFMASTMSGGTLLRWDGASSSVVDDPLLAGLWAWGAADVRSTESGTLYMPNNQGQLVSITPDGVSVMESYGMDYQLANFTQGVVVGDRFYFTAYAQDPFFGNVRDLFVMSGPGAPPVRATPPVLNPDPYQVPEVDSALMVAGDSVYFTRSAGGGAAPQLFRLGADGTEQQVTGEGTGLAWDPGQPTCVLAGSLYFLAWSSQTGDLALCRTVAPGAADYAAAPVAVLVPADSNGAGYITGMNSLQVAIVGTALFVAVWQPDGGTYLLRFDAPDVAPTFLAGPFSEIQNLRVANGKIVFTGYDNDHGMELWVSDGTPDSTHVEDMQPGTTGSSPSDFISLAALSAADTQVPFVSPAQAYEYVENQAPGAVIATVRASDDVRVTAFRFAESGTATSADGNFHIDASGRVTLTAHGRAAGGANDYESGGHQFALHVQAADAAGHWSTAGKGRVDDDQCR